MEYKRTVMTSPPAERLELLYELVCASAGRIELGELIPLVIAKCRDVLDAEGGSVLLLDAATNEFVFPYVAEQNPDAAARLSGLRVPVAHSIAGAVVRDGHTIRVDDAHSDPRFYTEVDRQTGVRTGSLLSAPLRPRHRMLGVIEERDLLADARPVGAVQAARCRPLCRARGRLSTRRAAYRSKHFGRRPAGGRVGGSATCNPER